MLGSKKTAVKSAPEETPLGPLFFSQPEVITVEKHGRARLRGDIDLGFARATNSIPLTAADIAEAAKYYPIAFTEAEPLVPVAIVGLEHENYFVDAKGQWAEGYYVPSYVRKYPFVFMENPASDELTLCIDQAALTKGSAQGTALYENDQPSAFTKNALEFCSAYHAQHLMAANYAQTLAQKEMLSPQRSDIELASGRKIQLGGFQLIDAEKLTQLTEAEAFEWFKNGTMALSYYILQSHSNWRTLVVRANELEERKSGKKK